MKEQLPAPKTPTTILKALVKDVIDIIREESKEITQFDKPAYPGKNEPDFCTNADLKAQKYYVKILTRYFPGYGIIGEEEGLRIPCTLKGKNRYFIVDPLDGTKAYKRGQAHGIGTMIALIEEKDGKRNVLAAYVGNVNNGEVIGYGPFNTHVTRERFDHIFDLHTPIKRKLNDGYIMIEKAPWIYPPEMMNLLQGTFKGFQMMNGSIGTLTARLWTNEIVATVIEPARAPWDWAPLLGINRALGIVHLKWNEETRKLEKYEPEVITELRDLTHKFEILVHNEVADQVLAAFNN